MAKGSVYEGKTFEEAVRKGLDNLGLSRAEATITMIEEGKGGFLGFGARPFRVSIARRPGGAVREPEETRERRVSSRKGEERRGGRGGRDRDRGKDRDREAQGGAKRRDENRKDEPRREDGRRGQQPVRAEGKRGEERRDEPRRESRGEGREPRAEGREPRAEGREPRAEGREPRAEGREPRAEGREPRAEGREPRAEGREGRGGRREGRREERRPAAADAAAPAASSIPSEAPGEASGDEQERRRRRRGRRGGRGRRREGAPVGAAAESANGVTVEAGSFESVEAFEPHEAFEERREFESGDSPVEPTAEAPVARAGFAPRMESSVAVEPVEGPAMASSELAETSRRLTEELLRAMGFEATVTVTAEGNRADVTAEIATHDELLTGQKGEVRQALQHLLNRFLNRGEGSRYHLQLEINDFWKRRELELESLARSLADQAVSENAERVTDYLNSQERRIVHVTLKEDSRVKTFALGTGMIKRVAVAPADFPERTGEEDAG